MGALRRPEATIFQGACLMLAFSTDLFVTQAQPATVGQNQTFPLPAETHELQEEQACRFAALPLPISKPYITCS